MTEQYVELHAVSAFSFLEGASLPGELASRCAELDGGAMALLDKNGVYGTPQFHLAAKKAGIKAHIGSEIVVNSGESRQPLITIPVLASNRKGYQNLCRLITLMKLRAPKERFGSKPVPAAAFEELAEHSEGLICFAGGEILPRVAGRLINIFGKENVYAELQRHYDRDEEARNRVVIETARRLGLPLLATNGVRYAMPEQREILDVFTCLHNRVTLKTAGRLLATNSERYLKPASVMSKLFADIPEAITNTVELSSRLEFTLSDLGYQFPDYPVPPGETMNSFLRKRTDEGARVRYRPYGKQRSQIERELALIEKLGLAGYFLIVWDIVNFCRNNNILVQGRGSAANSAVCYSLGITAVDPIGMDLLFERFLSEERGEWPDIDLDLPSGDQRERAIQYVYERYGKLGAGMTANVITYRGRSAARDVGKVLDFDPKTLGRLASLVSTWEWRDPKDTTERQFSDAGLDLADPRIKKFKELYQAVMRLPRHLGQHSGGLVVCQGQLDTIVPLEPATMPGRVVVQWDKEDCADMGIIKIDLLGLGMMAAMEESIQLIRDHYHEEVDLAHLPQDDPAVYAMLQQADTIGLFQIESRAQMSSLPRLCPMNFYDLVVQVAIIRPGPIVGNMVHPYMKRRRGREEPDYMHPALEPVLKRTLGVPLFQEQLLRMAMICAGFTGGEAEELRRAFGFKRSEARMREIEVKLRSGMERNGITGKTQDAIVNSITAFALYGFPESHAASFALLAYASAYLKCHYLAAFTAALLNNQPMGFYQPFTIIKDAQRHGLKVRPIDITCSDWPCTLEPDQENNKNSEQKGEAPNRPLKKDKFEPRRHRDAERTSKTASKTRGLFTSVSQRLCGEIVFQEPDKGLVLRLGLRYVKGLREESARALVQERKIQPFSNIEELARRVPELREDEFRKLAEVGALNFINPGVSIHRRDALWQASKATRRPGPLLLGIDEAVGESPLAMMTAAERINSDISGTGIVIGRHPMAYHRAEMNRLGVTRASELRNIRDGRPVRIAGWVIVRQRPGTAKGFVFLSMEDETGIMNVIVTPNLFDHNRTVLVNEPFLLIDGVLQNQDNVISVKAGRIRPMNLPVAKRIAL